MLCKSKATHAWQLKGLGEGKGSCPELTMKKNCMNVTLHHCSGRGVERAMETRVL